MTDYEGDLQAHNAKVRGWQPIETAPKDGTDILVMAGERISIAKWNVEKYHKRPRPFFSGVDMSTSWWRSNQPTHWMPLPEPPKEA